MRGIQSTSRRWYLWRMLFQRGVLWGSDEAHVVVRRSGMLGMDTNRSLCGLVSDAWRGGTRHRPRKDRIVCATCDAFSGMTFGEAEVSTVMRA